MARLKEPVLESIVVSGKGTPEEWDKFHSCLAELLVEAAVQQKEMENDD